MRTAVDVVVIGAGNAGLCAALAARDADAEVLVLERAPYAERGGNSAFTAGAMRFAYRGAEDVTRIVPDLTEQQLRDTDFGDYTEAKFFDDLARVTEDRADPDLAEVLITRSYDTVCWLRDKGVRFLPLYGRQAYKVDGKYKFWGGLTLETVGGGPGLVDALTKAAVDAGVTVEYGARGRSLISDENGVRGVHVTQNGRRYEVTAKAVVLASGGFEANVEWRTRYLGPGWDVAKVRGSRFNTGDGIQMALNVGAAPWGQWSGAHAVAWEFNAPPFGDLKVGDSFQKHSYPLGIMVNTNGERFLDEGADFRNYTYAKYGQVILRQPGQRAWQIFDAKVSGMLRDEYRIRQVTRVTADSIEQLAARLDGADPAKLLKTIHGYNAAVDTTVEFNPNVLDGRRTVGLAVDKTNWANTLDEPPFEAYAVTCGVTFTFGGLRISTGASVIDDDGSPISGLYACGELVGGIFYFNYPGGSGLTSGAVFGRIAGANAGRQAADGGDKHA